MKRIVGRAFPPLALSASLVLATGCASISQDTRAYLGTPHYAASNPATVQILQSEPKQPKERLGEIILRVEGKPDRDKIERKLREAAAKLGADAVFIVYDKMHVFPVVYYDWWWGPMWTTADMSRQIVGVAIKYK